MAFATSPWGAGAAAVGPASILYTPAAGEIPVDQIVGIDIDHAAGLAEVLVTVEYPVTGAIELVFASGVFAPVYAADSSVVVGGTSVDLLVKRSSGWLHAPKFKTYASPVGGVGFTTLEIVYTLAAVVPDPPAVLPPTTDAIASTEGLRLAVMMSLFTDKRADEDAEIPAGDGDKRGWWADQFALPEGDKIGSHLWLLDRSTNADNADARAETMAQDALAWLIEDKVASAVKVTAEIRGAGNFLEVEIDRPNEDRASFRFQHHWDDEEATPALPVIFM